jgi:hypothetical protein
MPCVSVIIPSYNHAAYIGDAIQSVLDQSERDLELIIVDDGSRDDSLSVIRSFSDARMRVKSQTNMGAHAAINAGIEMSQGEFLSVLNSDDRYHPQRLEKLIAALRSKPQAGLAASFIDVIDMEGRVAGVKHGYKNMPPWEIDDSSRSFRAGDNLKHALMTENYLSTTSNYVFTRAAWHQHGPFRPLRYTHDWDFALRVIRDLDIILLNESLMQYRIHTSNTIRENRAAMVFELCWCMAVHVPVLAREAMQHDPDFIAGLLHSIHEHGSQPVLATLMAQLAMDDAPEREHMALQLLKPDNPFRMAYIEYIKGKLAAQPMPPGAGPLAWARSRLGNLARALKLR